MAFLTDEHLNELYDDQLNGKTVLINRGDSQYAYRLLRSHSNGEKGVVWKGRTDLEEDIAIKIIPLDEYSKRSLLDEMYLASKLGDKYFAKIRAFGDFTVSGYDLKNQYKAIATDWVDGVPINDFSEKYIKTVNQFIAIARQLFSSLAILRRNSMCHDDLHPGNVLVQVEEEDLSSNKVSMLRIVDTGSVKRIDTRNRLLADLKVKIKHITEAVLPDDDHLRRLKEFYEWKRLDDHYRATECLLHCANKLALNYYRMEYWERLFVDKLMSVFTHMAEEDISRRLDDPALIVEQLENLEANCKAPEIGNHAKMQTPFDYISAEMITNDRQFSELFSKECPWLKDCTVIEPLYIYGPRGCGKSSILRWLSYKTIISDPGRNKKLSSLKEIGIYISCSVELRSRFWLLEDGVIDRYQNLIIEYFNFLLLEELFDTLKHMWLFEAEGNFVYGFTDSNLKEFAYWCIKRIGREDIVPRFQGQNIFEYMKGVIRGLRWETWSKIQKSEVDDRQPDPSLLSDICRELDAYIQFFIDKYITFLVDDYSNQRIPEHLQKKLNQTVQFAKQGIPIFKVSSEYFGVNLEGVQEGREYIEINIGEKYTDLIDKAGYRFLADIMNLRLKATGYSRKIKEILGDSGYSSISYAIANEKEGQPFYYNGLDCVHQICSGDVALALDVIKRIFLEAGVDKDYSATIPKDVQHKAIQQFSHEEVRRIKHIVPYGDEMYDIICCLGALSRAFLLSRKSLRLDKAGKPVSVTHIDISLRAIQEIRQKHQEILDIYNTLKSRAIFVSLFTSRSRIEGATERVQMRRIYFPAFKAPLKRDEPIKIDFGEALTSLLSDPRAFVERLLKSRQIEEWQLDLAFKQSLVKPREH